MKTHFLLTAALTLVEAERRYQGDGTAYELGQISGGNCNFMDAMSRSRIRYVAMNNDQWDNGKACGRCVEVRCIDDECADNENTMTLQVLDRCPECIKGALDISEPSFTELTGSHPSRLTMDWKFVDCPMDEDKIKYCTKSGSNPYWLAIQPTSAIVGVKSMKINGQPAEMLTSAYYYLYDGESEKTLDLSAITITLTSVTGEVVEETVPLTTGKCTQGSKQFQQGIGGGQEPRDISVSDEGTKRETQYGEAEVTKVEPEAVPSTTTSLPETPYPTATPPPKTPKPTTLPPPKSSYQMITSPSEKPEPTTTFPPETPYPITNPPPEASKPKASSLPKTPYHNTTVPSETPESTTASPPETPYLTTTLLPQAPESTTFSPSEAPESTTASTHETPYSTIETPSQASNPKTSAPSETPGSTATDLPQFMSPSKTLYGTKTTSPETISPAMLSPESPEPTITNPPETLYPAKALTFESSTSSSSLSTTVSASNVGSDDYDYDITLPELSTTESSSSSSFEPTSVEETIKLDSSTTTVTTDEVYVFETAKFSVDGSDYENLVEVGDIGEHGVPLIEDTPEVYIDSEFDHSDENSRSALKFQGTSSSSEVVYSVPDSNSQDQSNNANEDPVSSTTPTAMSAHRGSDLTGTAEKYVDDDASEEAVYANTKSEGGKAGIVSAVVIVAAVVIMVTIVAFVMTALGKKKKMDEKRRDYIDEVAATPAKREGCVEKEYTC